jgi:hypothetical protein
MTRWLPALAAGFLMSGAAADAHHSLSDYDSGHQVTVDGIISQFQFVNPHPFLVVDVKDTNGTTQPWRLEMDNRYELAEIGITKDTLKPGDRIVVRGNPGRSQPRMMYVQRLDRPSDGFGYEQVGTSPQLRPRPR